MKVLIAGGAGFIGFHSKNLIREWVFSRFD